MSDAEDINGNVRVESFLPSTSPKPESLKRKREEPVEQPSKQSKKRRKSKKPKDIDDGDLDEKLGVNRAIAQMDSRLLADLVAQRTKRFEPKLSLVELDEKYIPEKAIRGTSDWEQSRIAEKLPSFLEKYAVLKLSTASKVKGSPHTLVIAGAGIRAADLTRSLRTFETKEAKVAKLFAKHIKLKEAVETCKSTRMNIGVGTPQRIHDLLDDGALSSNHLSRIVVDASHIDQKKRGIMDMKETLLTLVTLLARKEFKERYGASKGGLELLFY